MGNYSNSPGKEVNMKNRFQHQHRNDTRATVRAEDCNGNAEKMIRRFSKLVKKDGIIEECRERAFFVKPTTRRSEKKRARERVIQKINRKRTELLTIKDRSFKGKNKSKRSK
jgi:ribosomal protein S21